jgi:hypothetical protein
MPKIQCSVRASPILEEHVLDVKQVYFVVEEYVLDVK